MPLSFTPIVHFHLPTLNARPDSFKRSIISHAPPCTLKRSMKYSVETRETVDACWPICQSVRTGSNEPDMRKLNQSSWPAIRMHHIEMDAIFHILCTGKADKDEGKKATMPLVLCSGRFVFFVEESGQRRRRRNRTQQGSYRDICSTKALNRFACSSTIRLARLRFQPASIFLA